MKNDRIFRYFSVKEFIAEIFSSIEALSGAEGFSKRNPSFPLKTPLTSLLPRSRSVLDFISTHSVRYGIWSAEYFSNFLLNLPLSILSASSLGTFARTLFSLSENLESS